MNANATSSPSTASSSGAAVGPGTAVMIYQHADFGQHAPPPDHPESPGRWPALARAWQDLDAASVNLAPAPLASAAQITALHPAAYWQALVAKEPAAGTPPQALDPDTWLGHGSINAAARGAGAVLAGTDHSWRGHGKVFCAARPPGHHAGLAAPMGFCLINPIALGAHYARRELGAARVAIVDFDVHHGNGTQDIFAAEPTVLYASSHQMPLYPGSGAEDETSAGNLINRPLPPRANSAAFRRLWQDDILPRIADFRPGFLFVSAGFDAHADDPLAQLALATDDYRWIGEQLATFADQHCHGRLVAMTEGGYHLAALTASARAFLIGLGARAA